MRFADIGDAGVGDHAEHLHLADEGAGGQVQDIANGRWSGRWVGGFGIAGKDGVAGTGGRAGGTGGHQQSG